MEGDGRPHADRRMTLRGGAAALTGLAVARPAAATSVSASAAGGRRLPFLLDMVQSNPSEPPVESRFDDPRLLAGYGYDGQVVSTSATAPRHASAATHWNSPAPAPSSSSRAPTTSAACTAPIRASS